MSLLGFMLVRRITKMINAKPIEGLEYNFYDVVVDKYSSQDNDQVLSILDDIIDQIAKYFPDITELMLASDNASCLASHDNIPFIQHCNSNKPQVNVHTWIYAEPCIGKYRLDIHFFYISLLLKLLSRMEIMSPMSLPFLRL